MKIKIVTFIFISVFFTGCFFSEPEPPLVITKYKYVKQEINVPELLFESENVIVPRISEELINEDLKNIQIYILELYNNNKQCKANLKSIKEILENGRK